MKKNILFIACCCLLCALDTHAQLYPTDSTTFTFTAVDSLINNPFRSIDTSGTHLWQIGSTLKSVFSNDTLASTGIMTDTVHPYPANANGWFTLKLINPVNPVIKIWHEYQTDSGHAGGIIEFSTDTGNTWINIATCSQILQNGYGISDTLLTGEPAFTGTSVGQRYTTFQLRTCEYLKSTLTNCFLLNEGFNIFFRFRFVSDTLIDSLAGWKIDSIRVIGTECFGAVPVVKGPEELKVIPMPAYDGIFNFPELNDATSFTINVYDGKGSRVMTLPYTHNLNIGSLPRGLYFYRVSGGVTQYSGRLLYE